MLLLQINHFTSNYYNNEAAQEISSFLQIFLTGVFILIIAPSALSNNQVPHTLKWHFPENSWTPNQTKRFLTANSDILA